MSSSNSSSSSIRNPYGNSSNTFYTSRKNNCEFEYLDVRCKCDLPAPCQEAWKEGTLDPGRRFFGCSQYKNPSKKCNFFVWADPPYSERAREVINVLKSKMQKKEDALNNVGVDVNFCERKMLVLHEEVCKLRRKNEEAEELLKKLMRANCILKKLLAVAVIFVFMFWLVIYDDCSCSFISVVGVVGC
ncbi:hypothetical protein AG4045_025968 [Apium graveolens]|uniref:GRF-type domain-containing protein n=1 Tax=Apium graveolens TaxID=4045 RepID=A0A6L5BAI3_APIGR|nr:hypothetical protein AG4045_025968 [Apium graveolens]